ncbi:MAG: carboxypeptidase regulatory-like domain-containing protein [Acidobacteriaceae bacterium]
MKKLIGCLSVMFLLLATFTSVSFAQTATTGDLSGTVSDPSGAVVPNAPVALKNLQSGESQDAVTNAQGLYRFSLLKPGTYSVSVNATGFQAQSQNAAVNLGQVTTLNIKAALAGTTTTVEVTTEAPLLQNDNANLSTSFNAAQIANLPAPGGDTTSYALTAPGVTISTGAGYGNFSAYGLPSTSNLFTVNGNDNMDPYLNLNNSGASNLSLGANEVQEVAVVENGYSVQYGRQVGAQVNTVTKSGTNAYHGNASYWYNSGGMNANDWFSNHFGTPRPHAVNNAWAASIGGHVIKNKLFFFADQEGLRYVLPGSANPVYLPSPQLAAATLANIGATHPNEVPFYQNIFNLYAGAPGAARAIPVADGGCGTDFALPGGLPCADKFIPSNNNLNTEWLLSTRVDYNISDTDTMFLRYRTDHGVQATGTDPISPVFNSFSTQPEHEGQLNETHVFGSTATNQFILSGSWYQAIFNSNNRSAALTAFPTFMTFGDTTINSLGAANNLPQGRNVTQYQITDDLSKNIGNHELKFGVNFRRNLVSDYATGPNTAGSLAFGSLSDFYNGQFGTSPGGFTSQYSQRYTSFGPVRMRLYSLAAYVQDQWKPRSNLSITAGIRIDRNANPTCAQNCFSRVTTPFAGVAADPLGTTPYNSLIQTGLSNAFPSVQAVNIQPRIGIAYSITPHTVIRTGAGVFSDLFPGTLIDRFLTQPPFVGTFVTDPASTGNVLPGDPGSVFAETGNTHAQFVNGFAGGASYASLKAANPALSRPSISTVASGITNPTYVEYNFQVEQEMGNHMVGSVNYVGNYGFNEFIVNTTQNAFSPTGFDGLPARRPVAGFGTDSELNNHGLSNYSGLTTALRGRFTNNLQASVSYTWSKAMDDCSNNCILPFYFNNVASIRNQLAPGLVSTLNYGPADYDTRHSLNANYVFAAPKHVYNGLVSSVLGGWTVAGTFYYHTGYPFSAIDSGIIGNQVFSQSGQVLATAAGPVPTGACTSPTKGCFGTDGTTLFVPSGTETGYGNLKRNSFRGPGYFDTDMNLTKNFHIGERFVLGLGANAFNILNHPNFDLPTNDIGAGASSFGYIQNSVSAPTSPYGSFTGSAVSGRVLQLNAHVSF